MSGVLVDLYNNGLLTAGLNVVETLCFMAWLNELGARAVAARTQDIDLAARQRLRLAAPLSFLEAVQGTRARLRAGARHAPHRSAQFGQAQRT